MSLLQQRSFTAGDKRKFIVDYSEWLDEGITITSFTAASDTTDVVVSGVAVNPTGTTTFFVSGGTTGETATISITMTDTRTNIKKDTVLLQVVAP